MQVATQAFAPVTRRFRPFLAGAFPASPLSHRPCLIFLLFHPLPCRTTLFATSWRCGTIVSYLARGQRLLWECILKQGAPRLSARGSSAGRGSFFPPTHPTTQGICAGGIGGAVPCRLFWLWTVRRAGLSVKPSSVPLRCARVVVFFNCFERFGYCCDAASKPQLLEILFCTKTQDSSTTRPAGAADTDPPTNVGRRGRGGITGL